MRKYEEFKKDIHSVGRVGAEQTQGDISFNFFIFQIFQQTSKSVLF